MVVYLLRESSAAGGEDTKFPCAQPIYSGISPRRGQGEYLEDQCLQVQDSFQSQQLKSPTTSLCPGKPFTHGTVLETKKNLSLATPTSLLS